MYSTPKVVLSIAGSDSCAGAGVQADLKTISALGGYGATVITAITSQNTEKVCDIFPVSAKSVQRQIESLVQDDISIDAIKIGMIYSVDTLFAISKALSHPKFAKTPKILDPVLMSTSGDALSQSDEIIDLIKSQLIPKSLLITPNMDEAAALCGYPIHNLQEAQVAAKDLLRWGSYAVLIKGGHAKTTNSIHNIFVTQRNTVPQVLTHQRISIGEVHGTGCTLSSAIATYVAQTKNLEKSVRLGINYVLEILKNKPLNMGRGAKLLHHFFNLIPPKV